MVKPLGSRVLLKPSTEEEKSAGGIFLPDSAQKRPHEGKVIALGPGKILDNGERAPMRVKEGDVVIFSEYGGTEIRIDGEEYILIEEDQLLAIRQ